LRVKRLRDWIPVMARNNDYDFRRLLGRNPFEKGFLPNHLPKTFNILLKLNFWKSIEIKAGEVIEAI